MPLFSCRCRAAGLVDDDGTLTSLFVVCVWLAFAVGYLAIEFLVGIWATGVAIEFAIETWKLGYVFYGFFVIEWGIWAGLLGWYIVAVRSMSNQVKAGTLSKDGPAEPAAVVQAVVVTSANPVEKGDTGALHLEQPEHQSAAPMFCGNCGSNGPFPGTFCAECGEQV